MLNDTPEWKALEAHQKEKMPHLRELFAADPQRAKRLQLQCGDLRFDYARHLVTDQTLPLLSALATAQDVADWRDKMVSGAPINNTENRAALHTALRAPADQNISVNGENVMPFIHETLAQMQSFSDQVRDGSWTGLSGQPIKTVINIGIGGSDLGPRLVCDALKTVGGKGPDVRFVANLDPADLEHALRDADPATTLFLIASKSFTTQETMANAQRAKEWFLNANNDKKAIKQHFVGLTANTDAARAFGIDQDNIFPLWDWIGGRYSLWSAVGLSICIAHGFESFRALLDGAHEMDRHFQTAPLDQNIPIIMALLGLWYRNFHHAQSYAVLPYSQDLALLPAWLQQLDMESNGKSIDRDGNPVTYATGPVVFGQPGTNGQHAFHQLLHQGTITIPCDFIAALENSTGDHEQHQMLLTNMAAQAEALAFGRKLEEADGQPHRVFAGNKPSSILLMPRLDAHHLGMLLALYEHKIFTQGIIWNVNSFDQWGVELGKELAASKLAAGKNLFD